MAEPRIIYLVHSIPGRTRLRLRWLRETPDDAVPLAEHLAGLDESMEVQVRAWTGSVLCSYDPEELDTDDIVAAVRRHTGVAIVLEPGDPHPAPEPDVGSALGHGSLRDSVSEAFGEINRDIMHSTGGKLDLGALTGLGFLGVGALEIVGTRSLPAPPWFNLAWWAYRTFTISGGENEVAPNGNGQETDGE